MSLNPHLIQLMAVHNVEAAHRSAEQERLARAARATSGRRLGSWIAVLSALALAGGLLADWL